MQGTNNYNLLSKFNTDDFDSPFPNSLSCPYITNEEYNRILSKDKFTILSANIRSLPNKMCELSNFLKNDFGEILTDCVALQEIWNVLAGVQLNIRGYHSLIYKTRCSTGLKANIGGGVGFFLNNKWEYEILDKLSIFKPHVFESLFLKIYIDQNKYIIVGNIYRPNTGALASISA